MNPPDIPPTLPVSSKIRPLQVLLHVGITYGLSLAGGFVIGVVSAIAHQPRSMLAIAASNIICSVAGFTIAGYRSMGPRWPHLFLVAGGLWLLGLLNLAFGFSFVQWMLSSVVLLIAMGIGGGLASLLKRNNA